MHPYEIQRLTSLRGKDLFVEHKTGSLYSVIDRLERDGLIEAEAVNRKGRLPERTVYRITSHGREAFIGWLRSQLAEPLLQDLPRFVFAVEKLVHLAPEEVTELLTRRADDLEKQIHEVENLLRDVGKRDVPRISLIEIDYALTMKISELNWVRGVLAELEAGELRWNAVGVEPRPVAWENGVVN